MNSDSSAQTTRVRSVPLYDRKTHCLILVGNSVELCGTVRYRTGVEKNAQETKVLKQLIEILECQ